jgi:hypothetical protein
VYILTDNFSSDGRQCNFVELNSKKLPPQNEPYNTRRQQLR